MKKKIISGLLLIGIPLALIVVWGLLRYGAEGPPDQIAEPLGMFFGVYIVGVVLVLWKRPA